MKNWRKVGEASQRPSGPVTVAKTPITKQPEMLTMMVPQGKVSPTAVAIQPETPQRAKLPRPPPTNIHNAFHINPSRTQSMCREGVISAETYQAVLPTKGTANPIAGLNDVGKYRRTQ